MEKEPRSLFARRHSPSYFADLFVFEHIVRGKGAELGYDCICGFAKLWQFCIPCAKTLASLLLTRLQGLLQGQKGHMDTEIGTHA